MTGELLSRSLTRRQVLFGATTIAINALAVACGSGSSATNTPQPAPATTAATPIPATAIPTVVPTVAPTIQPSTPLTVARTPFPTFTPTAALSLPTVGATLATTTASPATPLIVFAGASNVAGRGVAPTENFVAQTMALLAPARYDAVNLGVSGQALSTLNAGAPKEIDPLYAASRGKNIVVVYNSGGNDMSSGKSGEDVYAALVAFSQGRRSVGFKVVMLSSLPGNFGKDYETARQANNGRMRVNLASFADALADIGADPTIGAPGANENREYYQGDGIHLSPKGHGVVAGIVKAAILML